MKLTISEFHLSNRERVLALAIIFTIFGAFYKFWFMKQAVDIERLSGRVKSLETAISIENKMLQVLHAKSVQAIQNDVKGEKYSKYIEASRYLSSLVENLGASGEKNHIKLLKMKVGDRIAVADFFKNSFELEIESTFVSLGKFLGAIDSSKLLIEVKSVSLSRIDSDMKRCVAVIEVDGYYKPEGG